MNQASFRHALDRAAGFLRLCQLAEGNFLTFISRDFRQEDIYPARTVFMTALILDAIGMVDGPDLAGIKLKAADLLLKERSGHWSWNYWERGAPESVRRPYPDDIDDTMVALSAVGSVLPEKVDGRALAHVVKMLAFLEIEPGGPYRTWLGGPAQEVPDAAVNANIFRFLSAQEVILPRLRCFLELCVRNSRWTSRFYTPLAALYFLSRAGPAAGLSPSSLARNRDEPVQPVDVALAANILWRNGDSAEAEALTRRLLDMQRPDGGWPAGPFWIDHIAVGPYYAGSDALTAALAMQAVHLCLEHMSPPAAPAAGGDGEENFRQDVLRRARKRAAELPGPLPEKILEGLNQLSNGDLAGEIILLPRWWKEALRRPANVSEEDLKHLALANLWGWLAYALADAAMDEGRRACVPPAMCALRECILEYAGVLRPADQELARKMMSRVDAANLLEMGRDGTGRGAGAESIRLESKAWAEKSIGHALGPLLITSWSGYAERHPGFQTVLEFFSCYLAARQLNDDAHDWEEDMSKGRFNPVSALLTSTPGIPADSLRQEFWEHRVLDVSSAIRGLLAQARAALADAPLRDTSRLERLLTPLDAAARRAAEESRNTLKFLAAYRS